MLFTDVKRQFQNQWLIFCCLNCKYEKAKAGKKLELFNKL